MFDWVPSQRPGDVGQLFDQLVRLVRSMLDPKLITVLPDSTAITLTALAGGQLIPHGGRQVPKLVNAQVVGGSASTAIVTVGERTATHVRLYATAACQVHLTAWF